MFKGSVHECNYCLEAAPARFTTIWLPLSSLMFLFVDVRTLAAAAPWPVLINCTPFMFNAPLLVDVSVPVALAAAPPRLPATLPVVLVAPLTVLPTPPAVPPTLLVALVAVFATPLTAPPPLPSTPPPLWTGAPTAPPPAAEPVAEPPAKRSSPLAIAEAAGAATACNVPWTGICRPSFVWI